MPSTIRCVLNATEQCNDTSVRIYLKGKVTVGAKGSGFGICRQCATKMSERMLVDAVVDGGDIEAMFKDIMDLLKNSRDLQI